MEFYEAFNFLIILQQSLKILQKNGKSIAAITTLSLTLTSILIFLFIYSFKFLIIDMMEPSDSNSYAYVLKYCALLLVIYIAFLFSILVISLFSDTATILVSAMSHCGKTLSTQYLILRIKKPLKRPLANRLNISSRLKSYLLVVILLTILILIYPNYITISFGVIGLIFTLYLSVVWVLAIVISTLEENCYGAKAVERAEKLVKGHRLHGFKLNLILNFLFLIIFLSYWIAVGNKGFANLIIFGWFMTNISILVKILTLVAYSVLYFECKKHHSEEIESLGDIEYIKFSTTEMINDAP